MSLKIKIYSLQEQKSYKLFPSMNTKKITSNNIFVNFQFHGKFTLNKLRKQLVFLYKA